MNWTHFLIELLFSHFSCIYRISEKLEKILLVFSFIFYFRYLWRILLTIVTLSKIIPILCGQILFLFGLHISHQYCYQLTLLHLDLVQIQWVRFYCVTVCSRFFKRYRRKPLNTIRSNWYFSSKIISGNIFPRWSLLGTHTRIIARMFTWLLAFFFNLVLDLSADWCWIT